MTRYECYFTYSETKYDAVVTDLSFTGAFISSNIMPPKGSKVVLTLNGPLLKKPLILEGKVIHGGRGMSDYGNTGRFGIGFASAPLDLMEFISKIISKKSS
jgi:hypothetical protein